MGQPRPLVQRVRVTHTPRRWVTITRCSHAQGQMRDLEPTRTERGGGSKGEKKGAERADLRPDLHQPGSTAPASEDPAVGQTGQAEQGCCYLSVVCLSVLPFSLRHVIFWKEDLYPSGSFFLSFSLPFFSPRTAKPPNRRPMQCSVPSPLTDHPRPRGPQALQAPKWPRMPRSSSQRLCAHRPGALT
ncbi:hypothetical protein BO70DRAFT_27251 [Aspergillus heteromorphus CBS 117.55]|uniref:Uncharacterized protein n=1 Tax=Aspergillus heteromorphus CBS 117.55 TaxID=1448321 RepID=A0A317WH26_9EURO|nr:uncharacterized protein BO70DRAFT_27251 [Aspergillus heteromorphus CBS 117.55]PWY83500.1 hypothetical protein BO70DRAFT_27251 [Aspergillus heteromorphus CBS 117.55]